MTHSFGSLSASLFVGQGAASSSEGLAVALMLLVAALLLIKPGIQTDLIGAALFIVVFLLQWFRRKREAEQAASA